MRKIVAPAVLLLAASVLGTLLAQEPAGPATRKATAEEMKRLAGTAKLDGIVGGISGNSISVIIPDNTQWMLAKRKYDAIKNPAQREEAKKILDSIPRGKEYEIELAEKCSLRKANAMSGPEFDDKGNLKVLGAAELAKMKGTGPGWKATPEDIAPGLGVTVTLARDKKDSNKPVATSIFVNNKKGS